MVRVPFISCQDDTETPLAVDKSSVHEKVFPIARLTPELLAEVFYWYILAFYEARRKREAPNPYAWMTVRHVCRQWRQVSLEYPKLSTLVCIDNTECAEYLLQGAGELTVTTYTAKPRLTHSAFRWWLSHIEQISSATLYVPENLVNQMSSPQLERRLTSPLHSLKLEFQPTTQREPSRIPPLLPKLDFPFLAELILSRANLTRCQRMLVPTLRNLDLQNTLHLSVEKLVVVLRGLPALERLSLSTAVDTITAVRFLGLTGLPMPTPRSVATLRHLRILRIHEAIGVVMDHVHNHIIYPANTSLTLSCSRFQMERYNEFLLPSIARKLRGEGLIGEPPTLRCLCFGAGFAKRSPATMEVCLKGRERCRSPEDDFLSPDALRAHKHTKPALFDLFLCGGMTSPNASSLLTQICISEVRELHIYERGQDSNWSWLDILRLFPLVEVLDLEYETWDDGLDGFVGDGAEVADLLPGLKAVTLHELRYGTPLPPYLREIPCRLAHLAAALRERKGLNGVKVSHEFKTLPKPKYNDFVLVV